jgi:hypothetical protein
VKSVDHLLTYKKSSIVLCVLETDYYLLEMIGAVCVIEELVWRGTDNPAHGNGLSFD